MTHSKFTYCIFMFIVLCKFSIAQTNNTIQTEVVITHQGKEKKLALRNNQFAIIKTHRSCNECFVELDKMIYEYGKKNKTYFIELIKETSDPIWYYKKNKKLGPHAAKVLFVQYKENSSEVVLFNSVQINLEDISPLLVLKQDDKLYLYKYNDMYNIGGLLSTFKADLDSMILSKH